MKRVLGLMAVWVAMVTSVASVEAAEMVDNPMYKSWAGQKIGTTVVHTMEIQSGQLPLKIQLTRTLKEVAADKITLSASAVMEMLGQKQEQPAEDETIPAQVEAGANALGLPDFDAELKETGKEKIVIGGKTYECKIYEGVDDKGEGKTTIRAHVCEEVPGRIVKLSAKNEGEQVTTMNLQLVSVQEGK